jgi:predicted extracellular nuclease
MRKAIWLIAGLLSCSFQSYKAFTQNVKTESEFTGAFYNVENLFDTINHPDFRDDDFTPLGSKSWNSYRYWAKLKRISQVLTNAGQWNGLSIIGLCEIENRNVLIDLVSKTSLKKYDYRIVHEDSKDERGIDVALLFKASRVKKKMHRCIYFGFPN